jgi:hypothetical protein
VSREGRPRAGEIKIPRRKIIYVHLVLSRGTLSFYKQIAAPLCIREALGDSGGSPSLVHIRELEVKD